MASIRDVARAAGVSPATVSNVLNGRSDKVSLETRERVLAAVRELRYRPTALEHRQKAILSQNLGVMVPDLTEGPLLRHGYFRNILDGVLEGAALKGWSLTIFVQRMWYDVGQAVRRSYDGRCDALVMVAPQPGNEVVQLLSERGTPIVFVGSTPWVCGISLVDLDNEAVGKEAARHLVQLNHRRLAYVGYEYEQVSSVERREAFFTEAAALGIPASRIHWVRVARIGEDATFGGEIAARQILAMPNHPTGLFGWHDGLAGPLVQELLRFGKRVPEEFSVVSVDDAPEALDVSPRLTTFSNPLHDIGRHAATMIIDRLVDGRETVESFRFSPRLILRESTATAPLPSGIAER